MKSLKHVVFYVYLSFFLIYLLFIAIDPKSRFVPDGERTVFHNH
jgi:hypothetical protein